MANEATLKQDVVTRELGKGKPNPGDGVDNTGTGGFFHGLGKFLFGGDEEGDKAEGEKRSWWSRPKAEEGDEEGAKPLVIPLAGRIVLLFLGLLAYGAVYVLLFSTVLAVTPAQLTQFAQAPKLTAVGFTYPPPTLGLLVANLDVFLSWLVWGAMGVVGLYLLARERIEKDEDGDLKVVVAGLGVLAITFAFGTQVHSAIESTLNWLGFGLVVSLESFRYVVAIVVGFAALWKSVEGDRDFTALYGCLMLEGMLFRWYNPNDLASLTLLSLAVIVAVLELRREGKGYGVISKTVGTVVVFGITYSVIYDAIVFLSSKMLEHEVAAKVLGSTGNVMIYHVEIIAIVIAFLVSRAFAKYAMEALAWCGNGKIGWLAKLATTPCDQANQRDYYLSLILFAAWAMIVSQLAR